MDRLIGKLAYTVGLLVQSVIAYGVTYGCVILGAHFMWTLEGAPLHANLLSSIVVASLVCVSIGLSLIVLLLRARICDRVEAWLDPQSATYQRDR